MLTGINYFLSFHFLSVESHILLFCSPLTSSSVWCWVSWLIFTKVIMFVLAEY